MKSSFINKEDIYILSKKKKKKTRKKNLDYNTQQAFTSQLFRHREYKIEFLMLSLRITGSAFIVFLQTSEFIHSQS